MFRPAILGALIALVFCGMLGIGLYLSPLRTPIYWHADSEFNESLSHMHAYQDKMQELDLQIRAEASDSLKAQQSRLWQVYRELRIEIATLSKTQEVISLSGFFSWVKGLWLWLVMAQAMVTLCFTFILIRWAGNKNVTQEISTENVSSTSIHSTVLIAKDEDTRYFSPMTELSQKSEPQRVRSPINLAFTEDDADLASSLQEALPIELDASDLEAKAQEYADEDEKKAEVYKLARRGLTSSEISRRLRMSQDQVEMLIRLRREKG